MNNNISIYGASKSEALKRVMAGYDINPSYVSNVDSVKAAIMRQTLEWGGNIDECLALPVARTIEDEDGNPVFNPEFERYYKSLELEELVKLFDDAPENDIFWATPSRKDCVLNQWSRV